VGIIPNKTQLGEDGVTGGNAVQELDRSLPLLEVLPAKSLFASNAWAAMREHLLTNRFRAGENAAPRVDQLLGALDRVADLDQWTFRPRLVSKPTAGSASRNLTWGRNRGVGLPATPRPHFANAPGKPVRAGALAA
jgi:hypothetical protein